MRFNDLKFSREAACAIRQMLEMIAIFEIQNASARTIGLRKLWFAVSRETVRIKIGAVSVRLNKNIHSIQT